MSTANARLSVMPRFRNRWMPVKFFRIAQLRHLCECEQVAAVCYRVSRRGTEFLLVQTRNGRWTFPKGKAEPGLTHAQTAAMEAFEEAGVHGRMEEASFGRYFRRRPTARGESRARRIAVSAHLCEVSRLEKPSESKRNPKWFAPEDAKRRLREDRTSADGTELARIVARAVARIQRLQALGPRPEKPQLDAQNLEEHKRDKLQAVQFTIVERTSQPNVSVRRPPIRGRNTPGNFSMKPLLLRDRSNA